VVNNFLNVLEPSVILPVNQDNQASEWQEKIEMTPEPLAELQDKARQRDLSLFSIVHGQTRVSTSLQLLPGLGSGSRH